MERYYVFNQDMKILDTIEAPNVEKALEKAKKNLAFRCLNPIVGKANEHDAILERMERDEPRQHRGHYTQRRHQQH